MTKISQYPTTASMQGTDLYDISVDNFDGSYTTKSINYTNLLAQIQSDLTFTNYIKSDVVITGIPSPLTASASDQEVIGLNYTIVTDGDYVVHAMCTCEVAGGNAIDPLSIMLYKNGALQTNSIVQISAKQGKETSIQVTFSLNGLVATDVIKVYLNNNNDNDIDAIPVGRLILQTWI